ncbi:cobyrinic acid a,c-diamide synthase [Telmatospirillum siberiense]|uniref:Cobyrinic acid a,c-diamide synthase n=2 Tax=Telmatospirillum siberiense TaxID=382514 RepID=A0A2N3PZW2_9PROT|nr:ParA family partition ATPase [Telmatospirillum siberiense]PKU25944.1 cobyrinic acid a,c-diamide synthase [Telmatospirillum siberiense]
MTAKTVAIAQQKGGAGKTTIAVQLGVAWALAGYRVAMLDVDPQGSMSAWHGLRKTAGTVPALFVGDIPGWKLSTEIDRLKNDYDVLLLDTPPHAETDARVAVRAASLILVPLQPSPVDLWATKPTLELAKREKGAALLLLNRAPARGKLLDHVRARISEEGLPLARTVLGNRSAFAASMMEGKGVVETHPKSAAATEIQELAEEIGAILTLTRRQAAE